MTSNDTAAIPEPTTSPETTANPQTPHGTGKSDTAEQIAEHIGVHPSTVRRHLRTMSA